jgi:hypothetical protein
MSAPSARGRMPELKSSGVCSPGTSVSVELPVSRSTSTRYQSGPRLVTPTRRLWTADPKTGPSPPAREGRGGAVDVDPCGEVKGGEATEADEVGAEVEDEPVEDAVEDADEVPGVLDGDVRPPLTNTATANPATTLTPPIHSHERFGDRREGSNTCQPSRSAPSTGSNSSEPERSSADEPVPTCGATPLSTPWRGVLFPQVRARNRRFAILALR